MKYRTQKNHSAGRDTSYFILHTSYAGFTLIELLVAVALFSVVMLISVGSLISMSEADRKAETMKSVMNNLNFALDSMSRTVRTGSNYHCDESGGLTNLSVPQDCNVNGSIYIAFESSQGNPNSATDQVVYCLGAGNSCSLSGTAILRSTDSGVTFLPLTSSEVIVDKLRFYAVGACSTRGGGCSADQVQPKVIMTLSGYIQVSASQRTALQLQTTIVQRVYDQ